MKNSIKFLLALITISFFALLFLLGVKDERKMRKCNMILIQGHSKYATDKIDTTNKEIIFIDHTGKNV
jgi:hypothetical protein